MYPPISPLFLRTLLDSLPKADQVNDLSLGTGLTGFALASCRASIALGDLEVAGRSQAYFQRIEQLINYLPTLPPSLWGGVAGIAWVYRLCAKSLDLTGADEFGEQIIALLLEYIDGESCTDNIDLISGLAGIGLFAAHSPELFGAEKLANSISARLLATSRQDQDGIYWVSPSHYLGFGDREVFLDGARNLGLAHGIPGPLAFFASAAQTWPHISFYAQTANSIGRWLLSQQGNDQYGGFWSSLSERPGEYCRFAWCYGDLGVALAIGQCGRIQEKLDLGNMAARVVIQSFRRRPASDLYIEDAGLCHGWGGIGAFSQLICVSPTENETIHHLKQIADESFSVLLSGSLPSLPSPGFLGGRAGLLTLLSDRYANSNPSGWEALFGAMLPATGGVY